MPDPSPTSRTCPPSGREGGFPVQPGDLWQLGPHRLLCGDCTDPAQFAFLLDGERAALTVTSPPYNLGSSVSLGRVLAQGRSSPYVGQPDRRTPQEYLRLLAASTANALAVSEVAVVNLQMLAGNKVALAEFLFRFRHDLIDAAVWDKGMAPPAMSRNVLNSRFEFLFFLTSRRSEGRTPRRIPTADFRGTVDNVYSGPPQRRNPYFGVHAATFPEHLPRWIMETFDAGGGTVLDPFLGTGTTLLAANRLGRRCLGMEIEPRYCRICLERFAAETGVLPTRTGRFAAV